MLTKLIRFAAEGWEACRKGYHSGEALVVATTSRELKNRLRQAIRMVDDCLQEFPLGDEAAGRVRDDAKALLPGVRTASLRFIRLAMGGGSQEEITTAWEEASAKLDDLEKTTLRANRLVCGPSEEGTIPFHQEQSDLRCRRIVEAFDLWRKGVLRLPRSQEKPRGVPTARPNQEMENNRVRQENGEATQRKPRIDGAGNADDPNKEQRTADGEQPPSPRAPSAVLTETEHGAGAPPLPTSPTETNATTPQTDIGTDVQGSPHTQKGRRARSVWAPPHSPPPKECLKLHITGPLPAVLLALSKHGFLSKKPTYQQLRGKVEKQILWGWRDDNGNYHIYDMLGREEDMQKACDDIPSIEAAVAKLLPYRHKLALLPNLYLKYKARPLKGQSEQVLADALHAADFLKSATVKALHDRLEQEGQLYGKKGENDIITIYFSNKFSSEQIDKAHEELAKRNAADTSATLGANNTEGN